MVRKIIRSEHVKIKDLFNTLKIKDEENEIYSVPFILKTLTPYGYKDIVTLFRTEKQESVTSYFKNNTTLKSSDHHRLMTSDGWKEVKDITSDDSIITKTGLTAIKKKIYHKPEILYDLSVADAHCYYANDILSHNSWILTAMGAHALKMGKVVVHYTLELSEEYTGRRYDSVLTKIPFRDLKFHISEVEHKCGLIKGNLFIKEYNLKAASTFTLQSHCEDIYQLTGRRPDLIIIDYADRMKSMLSTSKTRDDKVLGNLYDEIKALAKELQIPVWSASQTNRQGSREEVVRGDTISDSFEKLMVADFVMSVSRQDTDKIANTGRFHIIKNRYGPDGLTYPASINTDFGHIQIFEATSIEGKETKEKMGNEGSVVKQYLANRFKDFSKLNDNTN